jgi:hypothetical protein
MANYLFSYHGGGAPESEEEGARVMAAWTDWFAGLGAAVVDGGNPVSVSKTIASDGSVSDGGGSNPTTGYSILAADSLEAAVAMAQGCPHLASGGSVEVAETMAVT